MKLLNCVVGVSPPAASACAAIVVFIGPARIEVHPGASARVLATVLEALGERSYE